MEYLAHTYTKHFFVVYQKFTFNWTLCILSGNPSRERGKGITTQISLFLSSDGLSDHALDQPTQSYSTMAGRAGRGRTLGQDSRSWKIAMRLANALSSQGLGARSPPALLSFPWWKNAAYYTISDHSFTKTKREWFLYTNSGLVSRKRKSEKQSIHVILLF